MFKDRTYLLALLVSLLFPLSGQTKSSQDNRCSNIDLRNEFMPPIRNQKGVSWCYAHSVADFINYSYQIKEPISASDLAINYNRHWVPSTMKSINNFFYLFGNKRKRGLLHQTGFVRIALKRILKRGVCEQSLFPDNFVIKEKLNGDSKDRFEQIGLNEAAKDIYAMRKAFRKGKTVEDFGYYYKFNNIDQKSFEDIVRTSRSRRIFYNLADHACGERQSLEYKKVKTVLNSKKIFKRINDVLERDQIIMMDYFANSLYEGMSFKRKLGELHTSNIVGRRLNKNNQCEYLIKNSYGTKCEEYHDSLDCEAGYLWMPKKLLKRTLLRATYIK
jgi:hypothetical protein